MFGVPPHDGLPSLPEFPDELARSDVRADPDIVEDDDIGPLHLRAPVVRLGDEAVGDFAVRFGRDVVFHRVALAVYLPGEVTDQSRVHRDEEESMPVHTPPIHGVDKVSSD